jgi:hypothetical protein
MEERIMKIYEQQGLMFNNIDKTNKKNISEKGDFQSIMDKLAPASLNKETNVLPGIQAPGIGCTNAVFNSEPISGSVDNSNKEKTLASLKDTLNLLDYYAKKLADPALSSESLSPLVGQLENRMDMLKDMDSSAGMNDKLKTIVSDLAATMGTEIERFKRGDYQ